MKIAFKGFRGFTDDNESIELKDITVLTGKNSSGKSTFIKLLQLLSEALKGVESLYDFTKIKINIANDIIGGKEKFKSLKRVKEIKWVFSVQFEFYTDYHEVHVMFDILDYILKVNNLQIFDEECLKLKKPFLTVSSSNYQVNAKYLFNKYKEYSVLYNILEEYRYQTDDDDKKYDKSYKCKFNTERRELGLTEEIIKEKLKKHITPIEDDVISSLPLYENDDSNYPFKVVHYPDSVGEYSILYTAKDEKIEFDRNDIKRIIKNSDYSDLLNEYIHQVKAYDEKYDFISRVLKWYNFEIENIYLSSKNLSFFDFVAQSAHFFYINKYIEGFSEYELNDKILNMDADLDFRKEVLSVKFHLWHDTVLNSIKIFEEYIVRIFNQLKSISYQSRTLNIPERSFNIFNSSNIFSAFAKHWKLLNKTERNLKTEFIENYLRLFDIADQIKIRIDNNIGFIHLLKKGNLFAVIDEGSGISNLLGSLLFIAQNINFSEELEDTENKNIFKHKQILVLEEPESNLHPCLQSSFAELIKDVIKKYNILFIIETHSEYLIRKLQYFVAKKELEPDSISLNYFNLYFDKNKPYIVIKNIPVSGDGTLLDNFGPGFFDEADNIAIDLFTIQQNRKN